MGHVLNVYPLNGMFCVHCFANKCTRVYCDKMANLQSECNVMGHMYVSPICTYLFITADHVHPFTAVVYSYSFRLFQQANALWCNSKIDGK